MANKQEQEELKKKKGALEGVLEFIGFKPVAEEIQHVEKKKIPTALELLEEEEKRNNRR